VYLNHPLESLSYHYERNPSDPRISHSQTLEVDAFGNTIRSLAIAYGRRFADPGLPTPVDQDKQTQLLITYTENAYTNKYDDPVLDLDNYRTPLLSESRTYELTGFAPTIGKEQFSINQWRKNEFELLNHAESIPYHDAATPAESKTSNRAYSYCLS
jgi:hypothetical protein